jgi:hypothetical protein
MSKIAQQEAIKQGCSLLGLTHSSELMPLHKYRSRENVALYIEWYFHEFDFTQPDKTIIEESYTDGSCLKLTLKEAFCYAYNLKQ